MNGKAPKAMSNLQDRLDKFKKTFESGSPPYNASREAIERCIAPRPSLRLPALKLAR